MANADGTEARIVTQSLELQGAPAWTPDGQSITVAAVADGVPRLFTVPLDNRPPTPFVTDYSVDPTWSPDGNVVVFSGADVGTTFPVKAVTANASAYQLANLMLTRGARRLAFMPGRRSLLVLRGGMPARDSLRVIDLDTGAERQLTDFAPDFEVRDFDVSADGREVVVEQVRERSPTSCWSTCRDQRCALCPYQPRCTGLAVAGPFYQDVFGCVPVPPERNLSGAALDAATGVSPAHLQGMHLRLPGADSRDSRSRSTNPEGNIIELQAAPRGPAEAGLYDP